MKDTVSQRNSPPSSPYGPRASGNADAGQKQQRILGAALAAIVAVMVIGALHPFGKTGTGQAPASVTPGAATQNGAATASAGDRAGLKAQIVAKKQAVAQDKQRIKQYDALKQKIARLKADYTDYDKKVYEIDHYAGSKSGLGGMAFKSKKNKLAATQAALLKRQAALKAEVQPFQSMDRPALVAQLQSDEQDLASLKAQGGGAAAHGLKPGINASSLRSAVGTAHRYAPRIPNVGNLPSASGVLSNPGGLLRH